MHQAPAVFTGSTTQIIATMQPWETAFFIPAAPSTSRRASRDILLSPRSTTALDRTSRPAACTPARRTHAAGTARRGGGNVHPAMRGRTAPESRQPRPAAPPRGAACRRHGPALRECDPGSFCPEAAQPTANLCPPGKHSGRAGIPSRQLHGMRRRLLLPAGLSAAGKLLPQTVRSWHVLAIEQRVRLHSCDSGKLSR